MKIEEMPAAIAAKCEEALVAAKHLAELDRKFDDGFNGRHTPAASRRLDRIETQIYETKDEFKNALFSIHGMMAAFESRIRSLAICDVEVE